MVDQYPKKGKKLIQKIVKKNIKKFIQRIVKKFLKMQLWNTLHLDIRDARCSSSLSTLHSGRSIPYTMAKTEIIYPKKVGA